MYFAYCKTEFCQSQAQLADYATRLDASQEDTSLPVGKTLYPPHVIVCHDTRYKENSLTRLFRVLGIGKFGDLAYSLLMPFRSSQMPTCRESQGVAFRKA